jgi:hypothetical protein
MVRYCVEITTRFQRGADSPFRPAGNEYAKREVVGEEALPDCSQQFLLVVFAPALIQAVDENSMRKGGKVQSCEFPELRERTDKQTLHLRS